MVVVVVGRGALFMACAIVAMAWRVLSWCLGLLDEPQDGQRASQRRVGGQRAGSSRGGGMSKCSVRVSIFVSCGFCPLLSRVAVRCWGGISCAGLA